MSDDGFGYGSPYASNEEYNPSVDPAYLQAMYAYLMGAGGPMMPSLYPAQVDTLYGAVPGSLNPTQQGNYTQDYLSIMADPMVAALGGSNAYSSDAFAPTTNYTPVATPGRDQLLRYTIQMPGTIEAYVAEHILGGGSASSALAELQTAYDAAPEDPEVAGLVAQLPPSSDPMAEPGERDWAAASQNFMGLQTVFMDDPTPGTREAIIDPQTGEIIAPAEEIVEMMDASGNPTLMRVESEASPAAEWYRERGLSLPTDEYTAEDLMGPEWAVGQARVMEALDEYERQQAEFDAATQAVEQNPQQTAQDEAFAQAVMDQALQSGYRPEGVGQTAPAPGFGEPTPFPGETAAYESAQSVPPTELGSVYDPVMGEMTPGYVDPMEFPIAPGASPTEQMMDAMTTAEQHEFINENLPSMTPEELAFTMEYLETHAPYSQTPEEMANYEADYAAVEAATQQAAPSAPPVGMRSTDGSRVIDLRPPEEPEETINGVPLSELDFSNGTWRNAQGDVVGRAATEDAPITPTNYELLTEDYLRQQQQAQGGIPRSEQIATGLNAQGRQPQLSTQAQPQGGIPRSEQITTGLNAQGQQPNTQAQLRFLTEQSTTAARRGGQTRGTNRRSTQEAERATRDQAYQRYLQQAESTYNQDYGRTMYDLYQMQQRGITPLQQQMAARRQVPIGMGLGGAGYLPGVG